MNTGGSLVFCDSSGVINNIERTTIIKLGIYIQGHIVIHPRNIFLLVDILIVTLVNAQCLMMVSGGYSCLLFNLSSFGYLDITHSLQSSYQGEISQHLSILTTWFSTSSSAYAIETAKSLHHQAPPLLRRSSP